MLPGVSRRGFLRLGLAGAGTALLAACGATPAPQVAQEPAATAAATEAAPPTAAPAEKKTISFAWWTGGEAANALFEQSIDRFEQAYPNVTVERMPITGEFATKILTMYGGGNAPDAHGVGWGTVWAWAHKGVLLNLTPLVERDAEEISWDDQWPAVTGGCYYPPGETIVALPRESFGLSLHAYNKTLFADAGVPTPDVDADAGEWTWERWRERAAALTKFGANDRREILGASASADYWSLQVIMPSYGVSLFNDDITHFNLDDPDIVGHIKMLNAMMVEDRSLGKPEETREFDWGSSGKQAIQQTATWDIPNKRQTWADIDWDFVPPPKGDCCHANFVGCDYHCVNGSDYADKETGWALIKFLNSPSEDLWWALNFFGAPFRKSNVEAWTSQLNEALPLNGWKYVMEMTESATPWTPIPFQDQLDQIHGNEIGQAILGDRPVEEVVESIAGQIDDMIAAFK